MVRVEMNRRNFLTSLTGAVASGHFSKSLAFSNPVVAPEGGRLALPTADQLAWQDMEIGIFMHFGPNSWQDLESDDLSTPLSAVNPKSLDTDQWAQCALGLGAKYIVFVAKHQGGFCMWQTQTTSYSIGNTPWRGGQGDVMADLSKSCRRYGLKLGVYLCPRDDRFGAATGGVCKTTELQKKYDVMYRQQLTEVLTRYGDMVEVWFDGSTATPVADLLSRYAPHAMIFQGPSATIRWVGNEQGFAPYPAWNSLSKSDAASGVATALYGDPNGLVWMPNEVDVSIRRPDFFWSTKNANRVLTIEAFLEIYYRSVGRGAQLLFNIPPDRDGLISELDYSQAKGYGYELRRRFGTSIGEISGNGKDLTLTLSRPALIDTVILQEECSKGERVRLYKLEGRSQGQWVPLGTGSAIGHKRIQPVSTTEVDAVRFTATEYAAQPAIRRLAAFHLGEAPPHGWDAPADIWAANEVGHWRGGSVHVDLTAKIDIAMQYQLRFVPQEGQVTAIQGAALLLDGVRHTEMIHAAGHASDRLILDITSVGPKVVFEGSIEGASAGSILLQKM
jgi:alpha-L-fucosidase